MARKAQAAAAAPPERDARQIIREIAGELVMMTPAWALMQPIIRDASEDVTLNIVGSVEEAFAHADFRALALSRLQADAPGLFGIGHNQPPEPPAPEQLLAKLKESYPTLIQRRDALLAGFDRFKAAHPKIEDDDTQGKAAELVKQIGAADKVARAAHQTEKAPWLALGAVVQSFFAGIWEPLDAAKKAATAKMDDFARAKAEASRQAAAAEAARQQAEAAEKARQAAETMAPEDLGAAAQAAQDAEAATSHAASRPAEHSRTRGEFGAVASLTVTYDVAITDFAKLPDAYKLPNLPALRLAMRQAPKDKAGAPIFDVPGVEVTRSESTRVR